MKKLFCIIIFVATLFSCSETVVNGQYTMLPLSNTNHTKIDCKNCFSPVEVTPLTETTNIHYRAIKKVESFNNNNYILCNNSKNILVVVNHEGKVVREIGRWGNGHGEHGQINDFCIDRKNKRVLMLCANSRILLYSLSGKFLSEKNLSPSVFGNIACIDGNILCTTNHQTFTDGEQAYLFYVFDGKFNLLNKHTNVLPDYMGMFSLLTSPLKVLNDTFIYSDFYTHRIYVLDKKGEVQQTYTYNENHLMPSKLFKDYNLFTENQFKYDFILDNIVMNDTILTIYKHNRQIRLCLNRRTGEEIMDFPIMGTIPKLYITDGKSILSVNTIEELEKSGVVDSSKTTNAYLYLVKYNLNINPNI